VNGDFVKSRSECNVERFFMLWKLVLSSQVRKEEYFGTGAFLYFPRGVY
jgi:hypothetical protein